MNVLQGRAERGPLSPVPCVKVSGDLATTELPDVLRRSIRGTVIHEDDLISEVL
jgi:hypothetical protein